MKTKLNTPVVFFIFNRPEETAQVFAEIRRAQPPELFIISDGPRSETERGLCESVRSIVSNIDWSCKVQTNFSEKNLGCGKRISTGLNWVFKQVEEAIILEDDCVPDQTFFHFCEAMLEKYRNEENIMHISGTSFQEGNKHFRQDNSYYFSIISNVWGWATWRRAWKDYDFDMKKWPSLKETGELKQWFNHLGAYERFSKVWDQYYRHEIDSWDGQWTFSCIAHHGLCINPSINLVTNIGFNPRGTHFKGDSDLGNQPRHSMIFPLKNPKEIEPNHVADAYKYRMVYQIDSKLIYRLLRPLKNNFPSTYIQIKRLFT